MRGCVSVIGFLVGIFCGVSYGGWEADKRLTVYPGYHDYGSLNNAWTIAVRDTMVHIVWEHRNSSSGSVGELYYIRSVNSGSSFDPDTQLTTRDSHYPSIAVCDPIVHVVWQDVRDGNNEIYYKRSVDNGENWGIDERLTNAPDPSLYSSIAVCDPIVHVVWGDSRDGNDEIYYKRSIDNGINWGPDERLSNDPAVSWYPSIAVCDPVVHVVWEDLRDGNQEIYYKRSVDNGENWGIDERLTNDLADSWRPSVAVCDSIVHVAWTDGRNSNDEIYYKRSVDNGENWEIDERLTNDLANSWRPSVAVCDSVVHVAWQDKRNGNLEIYYKRSVDDGENWGIDQRLTNDPAWSRYPSVACWDCSYDYDVHIAWTDERDGNQEIYYKRHKCEPSGVEEGDSRQLATGNRQLSVYPNPFTYNTVVQFRVRSSEFIDVETRHVMSLQIHDLAGRVVRSFPFNHLTIQPFNQITWDGKDDSGKDVPPGAYFCKLTTNDYTAVRKLVLIK